MPFDFEDVNTPEFPHNWKKGAGDNPFTMDITCRSIQLVFKDSGSKEFGAAVVTVDGKEVAAYDPRQAGWTHCHAAIILKEENRAAAPHRNQDAGAGHGQSIYHFRLRRSVKDTEEQEEAL